MDVFSRTFLPATSTAGLPIPVVSRHMPVVRHCVSRDDTTVLVSRCQQIDRPIGGGLFILTNRSLVVTRETRLMRRVQLHLATDLRYLSNVIWTPYPQSSTIEFAATVVDGMRERLLLRARDRYRLAQLGSLLSHVFRSRAMVAHTTPRGVPCLVNPVGAG